MNRTHCRHYRLLVGARRRPCNDMMPVVVRGPSDRCRDFFGFRTFCPGRIAGRAIPSNKKQAGCGTAKFSLPPFPDPHSLSLDFYDCTAKSRTVRQIEYPAARCPGANKYYAAGKRCEPKEQSPRPNSLPRSRGSFCSTDDRPSISPRPDRARRFAIWHRRGPSSHEPPPP